MHIAEMREPTLAEMIEGVPLSIVFAESESIEALRRSGEGPLVLEPPFHVSDEDAYLVLPEDIGLEFPLMFRDGDLDLLEEAMRDGLIAIGSIAKEGRGKIVLSVEHSARPSELLSTLPFAETVGIGRGIDPLPILNGLAHVQCTVASRFVDEEGLDTMLEKREYAGISWRTSKEDKHLKHIDPTYVWSKRQPDGRIGIECALFSEYEELVAVLRPAALAPLDRLRLIG
jgi:hypothetical protein